MGLLPQLLKIEVSPSIQRSGTNTTTYSAYSTLYLGLKFLTSKCDSSLSLWKFPLGVYFFILQMHTLRQTVCQDSHHPLLHPPRMLGPETQELHFSYPPAIRGLDKADSLPVRWIHGRSKREVFLSPEPDMVTDCMLWQLFSTDWQFNSMFSYKSPA